MIQNLLAYSGQEVNVSDPFSWWWQNAKPIGETLKVWAETIAYGSGGLFLMYKVLAGYFITDLSVSVTSERYSRGEEADLLAVTTSLKKGEKGTVRVHDVKFRVVDRGGTPVSEQQMRGIDRLSFKTDRLDRMRVNFDCVSTETPCLSLPPGDETQFAGLCEVQADVPYLIEVVILGRKLTGGKTAQWRASAVSLPKHG